MTKPNYKIRDLFSKDWEPITRNQLVKVLRQYRRHDYVNTRTGPGRSNVHYRGGGSYSILGMFNRLTIQRA